MANTPYENFVLQDTVEDLYNSHLNLQRFVTIDNSLEGVAGMKVIIHKYTATSSAEKVAEGEGNTKTSSASYTGSEYVIQTAQARFQYYDEQLEKDPKLIDTGVQNLAVDLFNIGNADIYGEFSKATLAPTGAVALNFDLFADIGALVKPDSKSDDEIQTTRIFAFLNPKDVATLRKNCKETLQYVEAFARTGYVGTVAGIDIFTKADATAGVVVGGTAGAVKWFNKKGIEVEQLRENLDTAKSGANTRSNIIYARKQYVVALVDATKAFKVTIA